MTKSPAVTLSGNPLDRAHRKRRDAGWLEAARQSAKARLVLFAEGKALLRGEAVAFLGPGAFARLGLPDRPGMFLGLDGEEPYFAIELDTPPQSLEDAGAFTDLRAALAIVAGRDCAILGEARSLLNWHARHKFCANCGAPSAVAEAGWKRVCLACNAEHFPRTDPVVIMLATHGERALLGRQPQFPPGLYTALAGFMEPGETIEEAVAREIKEESDIDVGAVRYFASQPWPFPSALMIGCFAEAASETIVTDGDELEDARWFSRDELRAALTRKMGEGPFSVPPAFAIAHQLIRAWAEGA